MVTVLPIPAFQDNYIWCLKNQNNHCLIVDPGDAQPVYHLLDSQQLHLTAILVTHHHFDHTNGILPLVATYKVPVYGSEQIPGVTHIVHEGDCITIDQLALTFTVLAIPGHTLEHLAYYETNRVFTGDTLFTAGCGKVFEGTIGQMYQSLQKLQQLPDNTLIYCGHEYTESNLHFAQLVEPHNTAIEQRLKVTKQLRQQQIATVPSSLALEKATNPFLRCHVPSVMSAAAIYSQQPVSDPVKTFEILRAWKNSL